MIARQLIKTGLRSAAFVVALLACACASIGTPGGGAVDEEAPYPVGANPAFGATDVPTTLKSAVVYFNELINVKDAFSKVTVSPVPKTTPRVTSQGKRVVVSFSDTLAKNTTYTIDFSDAIEDVNESNPLEGLIYNFSTGDGSDSLRIAGMVLGARDLEPRQGMLVGVHTELNDSAFKTLPLVRIARTDQRGRFVIRGLSARPYRVFALGDANRDYKWDNPQEEIAFYPETVIPSAEPWTTVDTVYNPLTGEVDSTTTRRTTRFLPNDLLLSAFTIDYKPQYLVKYERPDSARLQFIFGDAPDIKPEIKPLAAPGVSDWLLEEYRAGSDTIHYWIREPALVALDSLEIAMRYRRHAADRVTMEWATDTLLMRAPKSPAQPKKKNDKKAAPDTAAIVEKHLDVRMLGGSLRDVHLPILLETSEPIARFDAESFRLSRKEDTLWVNTDKPLIVQPDTTHIRRLRISYPWEYGATYRLERDTAAIVGLYGHFPAPDETTINIKKESDYAALTMRIAGLPDSVASYVELLNTSDTPVRMVRVENGNAVFRFVSPSTYYARLFIDADGDSIYTTGSYDLLREPEEVYYYPGKLKLRANWDIVQTWNPFENNIDRQKPEEITKNKPKSRKNSRTRIKKQTEEDEEDDYFDPTANPFDPNSKKRNSGNGRSSGNYHGGTVSPY